MRPGPFEFYLTRRSGAPSVLLESARVSPETGRYSICAKDPFLVFSAKKNQITIRSGRFVRRASGDPFQVLRKLLRRYRKSPALRQRHAVPLEKGGAIGYFSYECKNWIERGLPQNAKDDLGLPDVYFLFFDKVTVWDHLEEGDNARKRGQSPFSEPFHEKKGSVPFFFFKRALSPFSSESIQSSLDRSQFEQCVRKAKEYIRQGQIFQANLSQRLSFPLTKSAEEVYGDLRKINPSSFFGILDAGDFQIVSGSPERLVRLSGGRVETRPIAGTRPRGESPKKDEALSLDLMLSEKERAEHIMLVDLERNDLGRVSEYGSVTVDEFMAVEDYSHVKHIVSNVRGHLRKGLDGVDVLKAVFPGGTITGAPKVRSMQIIDELEPVARGPYTGSMGYFSFTGEMDFNIIIRSLFIKNNVAYLPVGAGIVADSIPEKEYEETLYKAEALLVAVLGERRTRQFFKRCLSALRIS